MRRILIVTALVVLLAASLVYAEEKMPQDKACSLLGDCGEDMVQAAMKMQAECESMMAKAKVLMDKGKMIRGQGILWQDKEMETDGQSVYDQGKKMYDSAKEMNDVCMLIIASGEKTKKKYKSGSKVKDSKERVPIGDHVPY